MRLKPLLFTLIGGFSCLVFSSYENGPLLGGAGNRTGSSGSGGSCDGGGCHASNSSVTAPTISITEGSSSTPSTTYTSGKTYTIHIGGTSTGSGLSKFGFQLATVFSTRTSTQAGTLTAGSGNAVRTSGSLKIVEHTAPIAGTGSGSSWTYATTATWVAPAFGSGPVKMFLTLNAVNFDGNTSGDKPNHIEVTFNENQVSVANTSFAADISVYPNPATTSLNIHQANAVNGMWNVSAYDMQGRSVYAQPLEVTNGSMSASINTASWAKGVYQLQLAKDGQQKNIAVVVQ